MTDYRGGRARARTVAESSFDNDFYASQNYARRPSHQWEPAVSNGPEPPPRRPPYDPHHLPISKTMSLGYGNGHDDDDDEELYISPQDIDSFPTRPPPRPTRTRPATMTEGIRGRPLPQPCTIKDTVQNVYQPLPSSVYTPLPVDVYTAVNKNAPVPVPRKGNMPPRPRSPRPVEEFQPIYTSEPACDLLGRATDFGHQQQSQLCGSPGENRRSNDSSPVLFNSQHKPLNESVSVMTNDTAIYGMAHGGAPNLTMNFKKIQSKLAKLYRKIEEAGDSAQVYELKMHLRMPEHASTTAVQDHIHKLLAPPESTRREANSNQESNLFVVDFIEFEDRYNLRQQLVQMFAEPGPPSVQYQKVDAKMDATISEFCLRVEELKVHRNEMVQSPAHARALLKGVADGENLVKALRDNQLWIRWGTTSFLPPLAHLYMHKQPPYYEVRKAVTISCIAERRNGASDLFRSLQNPQSLCPPIYSRLKAGSSSETRWQVTEYNEATTKFETRECQLPSWLTQEAAAWNVIHSSNRKAFDKGDHPYSLYCVYLVVIKDFTLEQDAEARGFVGESWTTPCKYQYYVNSSSTGVLYRFAHVENSHCERIHKVLQEAPTLRHFRCYEGCDLVEACLALSWLRRQPRAVFVLNSFLSASMSSMSLERKKPFHDKMLALQDHLAEGRKLGPLFDMRYGMCGTTTITAEVE